MTIKQILTNMETIKSKQLAFLNETISHFNSNNRGYNHERGQCSYVAGCAIGRKLTPELCEKLDNDPGDKAVSNTPIFNQLPDELKELGRDFLSDIQELHDLGSNWNETGLSYQGKKRVNAILTNYNL